MLSLLVLGRQPNLGIVELESLYGSDTVQPLKSGVAIVDLESSKIDFSRLGGSIKLAKVLTTINDTKWENLVDKICTALPKYLEDKSESKINFGLSVFGLDVGINQINRSTLQIKKALKNSGKSMRVIPNTELALNSAQLLHNKLTSPRGIELLLVRDGSRTILAQTIREQDIEAYTRRDQTRPKRDSKVGMLPPKLAQIIINLAVGNSQPKTILDPFCGTGVLLQEALLMNYLVFGTDIEPRMIEYSKINLEWLKTKYSALKSNYDLEVADATNHKWVQKFDTVASETYLGRPFSYEPTQEVLNKVIRDVDTIHKKFFINLSQNTKSGTRICLAVPAWNTKSGFQHLPILDRLSDLGYTRLSFVHALNKDLIYYREDQIVARELVVLIRK